MPFTPPSDWRGDINYSARTKAANFDALPALGGSYCGVLLVKSDDQLTLGLKDVRAGDILFMSMEIFVVQAKMCVRGSGWND